MPRVYIETTIPSYYFETRGDPIIIAWRESTRLWWDQHSSAYELCTSQYVLAELSQAPAAKLAPSTTLLKNVRILPEPEGVHDVVRFYIDNKLMPRGAGGDAMHLAFASLHNCDYLLTWNCRHLANANKARHIGILNARLGLPVPVITTPLNLIPE